MITTPSVRRGGGAGRSESVFQRFFNCGVGGLDFGPVDRKGESGPVGDGLYPDVVVAPDLVAVEPAELGVGKDLVEPRRVVFRRGHGAFALEQTLVHLIEQALGTEGLDNGPHYVSTLDRAGWNSQVYDVPLARGLEDTLGGAPARLFLRVGQLLPKVLQPAFLGHFLHAQVATLRSTTDTGGYMDVICRLRGRDARMARQGPDLAEKLQPGVVKTGSIASDVYLDKSRPGYEGLPTRVFVRALYWLSFQAPFPYEANADALEAARQRRIVAGLLTRAVFGRPVVAQVADIRQVGGRCEFVTELVPGTYPVNKEAAEAFLRRVSELFADAGLDTWQVWPHNPKALGNLIEIPDGEFVIIDLESGLVTPNLPFSHLWDAIKTAQVPSFDDINFPALRRYLQEHDERLRDALGEDDFNLLLESVARCHDAMHAWKDEGRGSGAGRYAWWPGF